MRSKQKYLRRRNNSFMCSPKTSSDTVDGRRETVIELLQRKCEEHTCLLMLGQVEST